MQARLTFLRSATGLRVFFARVWEGDSDMVGNTRDVMTREFGKIHSLKACIESLK